MTTTSSGRWATAVRGLVVVAVLATLGLVTAPSAQAHAYLLGSNPGDGAVLDAAPSTLVLDFSESVLVTGMTVALTTSSGTVVATGVPTVVGSGTAGSGEDPIQVELALPRLDRGAYQVTWSTVSADDLHRTSGVLVFGVGTAVAAAGWMETTPSPLEAVLRALVLAAVAVGVAAPVASRLLRRRAGPGDADVDPELGRIGAATGALGALAGAALLVSQLATSSGAVASILESRYAVWWAAREVGLLLLVTGALAQTDTRALRGIGRRSARALALGGALVATLATSLLGHSGSGATGSTVRTLVSVVHVLSTSCWLATLALLLLVLARRRAGVARVRAVLVAFGPVAGVSVGLMTATGLALASGVVGSLDALLLTDYGLLLVAKVVLVGVLLVAGLVTHRRLRRVSRTSTGRPRSRLVLTEAAAGAVVLLLTGLVTTGEPALERQLTTDPTIAGSVGASQKVGDLQEELTIRPNLPGQNVAVLRVADSRRPSPGPVIGVTVTVVDAEGLATSVPASASADGLWSAPLSLRDWGPISVRTVVQRHRMPATTGELGWRVAAPAGTGGPTLSRAPLGPYLLTAAWAVAAVLLVGVAIGRRRLEHAGARRSRTARLPRGPRGVHPDVQAEVRPVPVGASRRE